MVTAAVNDVLWCRFVGEDDVSQSHSLLETRVGPPGIVSTQPKSLDHQVTHPLAREFCIGKIGDFP